MDAIFDLFDTARDTFATELKTRGLGNLLLTVVMLTIFACVGVALVAGVGVALFAVFSIFSVGGVLGAFGVGGVLAAAFYVLFS